MNDAEVIDRIYEGFIIRKVSTAFEAILSNPAKQDGLLANLKAELEHAKSVRELMKAMVGDT